MKRRVERELLMSFKVISTTQPPTSSPHPQVKSVVRERERVVERWVTRYTWRW